MKLFKLAAVAAILTGTAVVAVPGTAQAARSQCSSGHFCIWTGESYNGAFQQWSSSQRGWGTLGNDEDSVYNRNGLPVIVYDGSGYSDPHYCVRSGVYLRLPSNKDQDGESHRFTSTIPSGVGCLN